uniref:Uncharacterized protein n=1 Tax=Romanomermis culicivorax TaxID=13658 RepID=A0A915KRW2_ROMCU
SLNLNSTDDQSYPQKLAFLSYDFSNSTNLEDKLEIELMFSAIKKLGIGKMRKKLVNNTVWLDKNTNRLPMSEHRRIC